jgi:NADH-quinone oxidoreductase subunit M
LAVLASTGIVLGAAYMLYLYRRVIFGRLEKEDLKNILDLNWREIAVFTPLVIVVLWIGIYPAPFLEVMDASVVNLVEQHRTAMSAFDPVAVAGR